MHCTKCHNHVTRCECGDIEERLQQLSQHPNFATDRCSNCLENLKDCECEEYDPVGGGTDP